MRFLAILAAAIPLLGLTLAQVAYSPDGTCGSGSTNGGKFVCTGTEFGDCCSYYGNCGSSALHCSGGCQADFGECTIPGNLSPDGTCGGENMFACHSVFGSCCSGNGYCGTGPEYCGAFCQADYSEADSCIKENIPSVDGSCGGTNGFTCTGGKFDGQCCSRYGFCGSTIEHCLPARQCQPAFGKCT